MRSRFASHALLLIMAATEIFAVSVPARADWKQHLYQHSQKVQLAKLPPNAQVLARTRSGWFSQKLDPANPADSRAFKQRFYVNTALADGPDSPVLYYICGEGVCTPESFAGEALEMATRYHATLVALEHRFYGASQPFNDLSVEHLRYLSVENALSDLARFEDFARDRFGLKGKWISIGGSYPGALSAYYRLRYPDHVVGALASSAPVESRVAFEDYDHSVFLAVGPQCASALQSVMRSIEEQLRDPQKARAILQLFDVPEVRDPVDFLYILADAAAGYVQYGSKQVLCDALLASHDPIPTYAQLTQKGFAMFGSHPLDDSFEHLMSISLWDFTSQVGARQWFYQSCAEFGFFQVAYHDASQAARSPRVNLEFHRDICRKIFGIDPVMNADRMNQRYLRGLLDPRTTNILFTNGSDDPWSTLSISRERGNAINPGLFTFMLQGASHCSDLGSSSMPAVQQAHELFARLIADWLR